jgi:hypothetical protein
MTQPGTIHGYDTTMTEGCELVTLLHGLGPWKESSSSPAFSRRYLVSARPPAAPRHSGHGLVFVVSLSTARSSRKAHCTFEDKQKAMHLVRAENAAGKKVSWRTKTQVSGGASLLLEFPASTPELGGGEVTGLPSEVNGGAINIPMPSIVFNLHETVKSPPAWWAMPAAPPSGSVTPISSASPA